MDTPTLCRQLLDATKAWYPHSVDESQISSFEMALAGLARCRRLLYGMLLLDPDLAGGLGRTIYETWITALYTMLGGEKARLQQETNDRYENWRSASYVKKIVSADTTDFFERRNLDRAAEITATPSPRRDEKMSVWRMTQEVSALSTEHDLSTTIAPEAGYVFFYGSESYQSVHAGLQSMRLHVSGGAVVESWSTESSDHRLGICFSMVRDLAAKVGVALGLDISALAKVPMYQRPADLEQRVAGSKTPL